MADVASLVFDIDSSQARGAAKALGDLNSATIRAANGAAKFDRTMRGADGRFKSTSSALRENREEIERLAQAYNPVLAAQIRFRDESIKTGVAVKAGVITEQQRIDILQRTKASLDATSAAASRFGRSQEVATHHVSNLSFQLNDIGMMMALGQNPFTLMIQQGPQVAQILGQMNQEGRKIGPTLADAFKMFLNPTTLVTLALIGGAAALVQWGMSALGAEKDAKSLADAMGDVEAASNNVKKYNDIAKKSIFELTEEFGAYAWSVRDSAKALVELEASQGRAAIADALKAARSESSGLGVDLRGITAEYDKQIALHGLQSSAIAQVAAAVMRAERSVSEMSKEMGISDAAARALSQNLYDLRNANVWADQLAALKATRATMAEFNIDVAQLPKEIREAVIQTERLNITVGGLEGNISNATRATYNWASAMSGVLGYVNAVGRALSNIGGTAIDIAVIETERRLLKETGDLQAASLGAARERVRLEGAQHTAELEKQHGVMGRILGIARAGVELDKLNRADALAAEQEAVRAANRESGGGGRSGGGGASDRKAAAELKAAEKGFQSLRELMEKESIFQFAEYEKRQSQLEMALNNQLLTEQQYDKMRQQLRTLYFGSDYEIRALQHAMDLEQLKAYLDQDLITRQEYYQRRKDMQWEDLLNESNRSSRAQDLANTASYFGQLQSLSGSNSSKLLKIQQSFQAASALLNAYTGASQVLADPTAPWWIKIAAAGKVLAAGIGFASAIKGGGSGGGGSSSTSAAPAAQEPTRQVMINIQDGWEGDLVENLLTQIYEQTKDGRVVISRG